MSRASTNPIGELGTTRWWESGLRYNLYSRYLRQRFGQRVQKVSLDAGFTCPNVDGTVAVGGCTFCDNRSFSPSRRTPRLKEIPAQLDEGIRRLQKRYRCERFLAYFQPATNTYAPVERLRNVYRQALSDPRVVGLVIGTRPDCVPPPVLELLAELAAQTYVAVEYGAQTMHNRTLKAINRGHDYESFLDAIDRSRGLGFQICSHIILGLPGESLEEMRATAHEMARLPIDAIKIHNLYIVRDTPMADQWARGELSLLDRDTYVRLVADILELLPRDMLIERISGEAPPDYLLAPTWCLDKPSLRQAVDDELRRRDGWQGKRHAVQLSPTP